MASPMLHVVRVNLLNGCACIFVCVFGGHSKSMYAQFYQFLDPSPLYTFEVPPPPEHTFN